MKNKASGIYRELFQTRRAKDLVVLLSAIVAGCGGGGGGGGGNDYLECNPAPSISSSPSLTANVGESYAYIPNARYICGSVFFFLSCYNVEVVQTPEGATGGRGVYWTPSEEWVNRSARFTISTPPDVCGNRATQTWTVRVGREIKPPTVSNTLPSDSDVDVPWDANIRVSFSEPLDPASVTPATIFIKDAMNNVLPASVTLIGDEANIKLASPLSALHLYTGVVTTGVKDSAGNPLSTEHTWTFTAADVDKPPEIVGVTPRDQEICISTDANVIAFSSEPLLDSSVNTSTFYLRDAMSNFVDASVLVAWDRVTLNPINPLAAGTSYSATLTTGATDAAGNPLISDYTWSFTTEEAASGTWVGLSTVGAPSPRWRHSAVWTGSEMFVWGGQSRTSSSDLNDGARYDPLTDRWVAVSNLGAPSPREQAYLIWTGTEVIVWDGVGKRSDGTAGHLANGARYNPATDTWAPISEVDAPEPFSNHTPVWTGTEMIVWAMGGSSAKYNPATDTWSPVSNIGAPAERLDHTAVWTGTEMIIWGGCCAGGTSIADGARYDPVSNTWAPISSLGAPEAAISPSAVWTGTEMLVWGGNKGSLLDSGGRYDPAADTWQLMTRECGPSAKRYEGIWSGTEFLLVRGDESKIYDPLKDAWKPATLSPMTLPSTSIYVTALTPVVWTGTEMLVWNEHGGGRYRP